MYALKIGLSRTFSAATLELWWSRQDKSAKLETFFEMTRQTDGRGRTDGRKKSSSVLRAQCQKWGGRGGGGGDIGGSGGQTEDSVKKRALIHDESVFDSALSFGGCSSPIIHPPFLLLQYRE